VSSVRRRRRGTAIVETERGIVVVAQRDGIFLLPGGGAERHETRTDAALRELVEEIGLRPYSVKFLFHHKGQVHKSHGHGYFRDHHTVCLVKATGVARPHHEIRYVEYYKPGTGVRISGVTREIIDRYYAYKNETSLRRRITGLFDRARQWFDF
jgi:8-oxo-dGTP diphosphatase